jgi:hypothetical protein
MRIMLDARWIGRVPLGLANFIALSMAEVEYVVAGSCFAQLL